MVQRLAPEARALVASAESEARRHGSSLVEAEHLLLAMSAAPGTDAATVLGSAGLTHQGIEDALERELVTSLGAAGVSVDVAALGRPSPEPSRRLRLGASFRASMERSVAAARGSKQIRPAHLLLGVLGAEVGTVPRALRLAGVDQAELAQHARAALTR